MKESGGTLDSFSNLTGCPEQMSQNSLMSKKPIPVESAQTNENGSQLKNIKYLEKLQQILVSSSTQ